MSKSTAKPVALAVATALGGLALSGATFSMAPLAGGYMLAAQDAGADVPVAAKEAEGRCGMQRADSDGDGRISAEEFAAAHPEKDPSYFAGMDSNGDGFVDKGEHDAHQCRDHGLSLRTPWPVGPPQSRRCRASRRTSARSASM